MPTFGKTSLKKLKTCDNRLQIVFNEVIKHFDCSILVGHRNKKDQDAAYNAKPQRSKLKWPDGKHNSKPSQAVDVAPYPIDWDDEARFYYFAGIVMGIAKMKGIKLRWGGDWDSDNDLHDQTFNDLVHFEVVDD